MQELTERQRGIRDMRDLFRKYNAVALADGGLKEAYIKFLEDNGMWWESLTIREIKSRQRREQWPNKK